MAKSQSFVRIIGGKFRGKQLLVADADGLRPTGSRIRETLFNWLAPEIAEARVVDLFAGSGALGFEALSRGARHVSLCELNSNVAKQLSANIKAIGSDNCSLIQGDAIGNLAKIEAPVHIIFIDPPFAIETVDQLLIDVETSGILAEDAAIYIEQPKHREIKIPENWLIRRHKFAGDVQYLLCDRA